MDVRGFFDYNIPEEIFLNGGYNATIKLLHNYGYRTIAINQTVNTSESIPKPYPITPIEDCEDMKILSRLTINVTNPEQVSRLMKSPNYRKFDIIAVNPENTTAISFISSNIDADIFCINPANRQNYSCGRKLYNQLVEKGYHLEVCYGPIINDSTLRRNTIKLTHVLHSFRKSKSIIISSGASNPYLLRGPYDVINLALIFGLSEQQAKDSIKHCGRKVYINSVGRRHGKTLLLIDKIEEKPTENNKDNDDEEDDDIICLDDDPMIVETDGPAPKKIKQ